MSPFAECGHGPDLARCDFTHHSAPALVATATPPPRGSGKGPHPPMYGDSRLTAEDNPEPLPVEEMAPRRA